MGLALQVVFFVFFFTLIQSVCGPNRMAIKDSKAYSKSLYTYLAYGP